MRTLHPPAFFFSFLPKQNQRLLLSGRPSWAMEDAKLTQCQVLTQLPALEVAAED